MKQILITVLAFLGIQAFAQDKDGKKILTEEQMKNLKLTFGDAFTEKFVQALAKDGSGDQPDTALTDAMVADMQTQLQAAAKTQAELKVKIDKAEADRLKAEGIVTEQTRTIEALSKKPEPVPIPGAVKAEGQAWIPNGADKFLFGEDLPYLAIDTRHPYNQRAYASLAARQGLIIPTREAASMDYDQLKSDLGDYYRVRKQDRIQAFVAKLPSLASIFPMESNLQDQAALVNMFLSEFSQADNTGSAFDSVVKGAYKFEPEIIRMFDVMFAHKFTNLKELEKNWLGYLNREGSNTMKWSFIEYVMVETAKVLQNEQEMRRVNGIRKNPTLNIAGTAMGAADGLRKFLKNQIALFKVKPFVLGEWSSSTIANYVYNATALIPSVWRDSGRMVLYMAEEAVTAYHKNLETLYGVNQDYKADVMWVKEYSKVRIIPIPGMGNSKRMIWTVDGNIILAEDKPGEMLNFNFEQQDWTLKVWSNWKESVWANIVGKKFASLAEMPDDYSTQLIWCNDVDEPSTYFIPMEADDVTPSVINHTSLSSVANTVATAITNIDDAVVGQLIKLKCGHATNHVTIAVAGNFSLLTGAWDPQVGDVIYLMKRSDGKFIELKRENVTADSITIAADDATPDVAAGTVFVTSENEDPTAITTLDNAVTGVTYTIYGGSDVNASTIANAGNFVLTGAMTLDAGSFIQLRKSAVDSKFYEISRG